MPEQVPHTRRTALLVILAVVALGAVVFFTIRMQSSKVVTPQVVEVQIPEKQAETIAEKFKDDAVSPVTATTDDAATLSQLIQEKIEAGILTPEEAALIPPPTKIPERYLK